MGPLQKEKKCEEVRSKCGTHKSKVILPSFLPSLCVLCFVFALFQSQQEAFIPTGSKESDKFGSFVGHWKSRGCPQMVPDPQDRQKFLKLLQALLPHPFSKSLCCKLKNCDLGVNVACSSGNCYNCMQNHRLLSHPWFERNTLANPKIVTWVTLLRHHTSSAVGSHNFQCYPSPTLKELLLEAKFFSVLPILPFWKNFCCKSKNSDLGDECCLFITHITYEGWMRVNPLIMPPSPHKAMEGQTKGFLI